jgi:hypothetical protein
MFLRCGRTMSSFIIYNFFNTTLALMLALKIHRVMSLNLDRPERYEFWTTQEILD